MCIWHQKNYELLQDNPSIDLEPKKAAPPDSMICQESSRLSRLLFVDTAGISANSRRLFTGQHLPRKVVPANKDVKIIWILEYNIVFGFSVIFRPRSFCEHCNWNCGQQNCRFKSRYKKIITTSEVFQKRYSNRIAWGEWPENEIKRRRKKRWMTWNRAYFGEIRPQHPKSTS